MPAVFDTGERQHFEGLTCLSQLCAMLIESMGVDNQCFRLRVAHNMGLLLERTQWMQRGIPNTGAQTRRHHCKRVQTIARQLRKPIAGEKTEVSQEAGNTVDAPEQFVSRYGATIHI